MPPCTWRCCYCSPVLLSALVIRCKIVVQCPRACNVHTRVSKVLTAVASLSTQEAEKVMMEAHVKGSALVSTLPKKEAEELVERMLQQDVLAEVRAAVPKSGVGAGA